MRHQLQHQNLMQEQETSGGHHQRLPVVEDEKWQQKQQIAEKHEISSVDNDTYDGDDRNDQEVNIYYESLMDRFNSFHEKEKAVAPSQPTRVTRNQLETLSVGSRNSGNGNTSRLPKIPKSIDLEVNSTNKGNDNNNILQQWFHRKDQKSSSTIKTSTSSTILPPSSSRQSSFSSRNSNDEASIISNVPEKIGNDDDTNDNNSGIFGNIKYSFDKEFSKIMLSLDKEL